MNTFQQFFNQLGPLQTTQISEAFKKQFKIRGEFHYPPSKQFEQISRSFLEDEKLRTKRKWDNSFKLFLIWFLVKYFEHKGETIVRPDNEDWLEFENILKIDKHTLKQRWITLINPQMKSTNWLPEEDEFIKSQMESKNKHIWTQIGVSLYELNLQGHIRTPKQIRERWMNYLNPDLNKEQWLMKEDLIILKKVVEYGKRWSQISQLLNGRTENQVKNRYKSLIHKICKDDECDEIEMIKVYIRKNQSHCESNKFGIVGKRGRHKKGRTSYKADRKVQKQIIKQEQDEKKEGEEQLIVTDEGKPSTTPPVMMFYSIASPGFYQLFKNQTPDNIIEEDLMANSAHLKNLYKVNQQQSPFMMQSLIQSPFLVDNQFLIASSADQDGYAQFMNQQQQQTQQIATTTPFLNISVKRPVPTMGKAKELDFLKKDNPIQQYNQRRNINQQ